jgi:hypothetical protein
MFLEKLNPFYIKEKLKAFLKNKKNLLLIGLVALLSLTAFQFTQAAEMQSCASFDVFCNVGNLIAYTMSLPMRIGFLVIVIPLILAALASSLLYCLMVALCNWMMSIFLTVGITPSNPLTPEIVTIGWTFTRDFVNMFFILIIAFIGLATILGLDNYNAKKMMPKTIILALLINFTPVLVGFIVDMGNIVTYFFMRAASEITNLPSVLNLVYNYLTASVTTTLLETGDFLTMFGQFAGIVIYGFVVIIFFLWASWIYFWVTLSLGFRITELWVLMIVCPIAFFSKIFKGVKDIFPDILGWDRWWAEFLKWIIWAIPIGFFLYLSNWILVNTAVVQNIFSSGNLQHGLSNATQGSGQFLSLENSFINLITSLLAPTLALVLLDKGYKIAESTAPKAAKDIIKNMKKVGELAMAAGITVATAGAGAGAAAGILGKAGAAATRLETWGGKQTGIRGIVGRPLQGMAKISGWGARTVAKPLSGYSEKVKKDRLEKIKKLNPEELENVINGYASGTGRIGLEASKILGLASGGKLGDKNDLYGEDVLGDSLVQAAYKGKLSKIMNGQSQEEKSRTHNAIIKKLKSLNDKGKEEEFAILAATNPVVLEEAMKIKNPGNIARLQEIRATSNQLKEKLLSKEGKEIQNQGEENIRIGEQTIEYGKELTSKAKKQILAAKDSLAKDDLLPQDRKDMNNLILEGEEMIQDGKRYITMGENLKKEGGLQVYSSQFDYEYEKERLSKEEKIKTDNLRQKIINETLKKIPGNQVSKLSEEFMTSDEGIRWSVNSNDRIKEGAKAFGQKFADSMIKYLDETDTYELIKNSPQAANFLRTTAAVELLGRGLPSEYIKDGETYNLTNKREWNNLVMQAKKDVLKEREQNIGVAEYEKQFKIPEKIKIIREDTGLQINDAKELQEKIDLQREKLDSLAKMHKKTLDQISSMEEKRYNMNEKEEVILKEMKKEQKKHMEGLKETLDSLKVLEKEQKGNVKDIKEQVKTANKEVMDEIEDRLAKKQIKDIKEMEDRIEKKKK